MPPSAPMLSPLAAMPLAATPLAATPIASALPVVIATATVIVGVLLMAAVIGVRWSETRRRARMLEAVLGRFAAEEEVAELVVAGRERGRPATLRRRRGGEWDTPIVPTVSTSPHRRDRRDRRRTRGV